MQISTNQFKNGTHIEVDGTIFRIVEFQHVKPGKGGAFVRSKLQAGRRRRRDRQDLQGRREVPAGAHRDPQDAVPLRLGRRGRLHGQPELRAGRDPEVGRRRRSASGCRPTTTSSCSSSTSAPAGAQPPSAVDLAVTQTDPGPEGRHRLGRRHEARDAGDRRRRPGAALHRGGRAGPGRHPQRRVRLARVDRRRYL